MISLIHSPAVVRAGRDNVYFLPCILADVAGPDVAGGRVERYPPRVAQAVSINLIAVAARAVYERVRGRDGCCAGARSAIKGITAAINVQAQNRTQKRGWALAVVLGVAS